MPARLDLKEGCGGREGGHFCFASKLEGKLEFIEVFGKGTLPGWFAQKRALGHCTQGESEP